jgi:hypothetical protein
MPPIVDTRVERGPAGNGSQGAPRKATAGPCDHDPIGSAADSQSLGATSTSSALSRPNASRIQEDGVYAEDGGGAEPWRLYLCVQSLVEKTH